MIPTGAVIQHNWIRAKTKEVVDHSNEFISSLPYKPKPEYMRIPDDGQLVEEKPGTQVLVRWDYPQLGNPPVYATWEAGEGRTFAMTHDWSCSWEGAHEWGDTGGYFFARWDYYPDYAINLMLYLARKPLPTDYLVVHQYREQIHKIALGRSLLLSLIEFVDRFGANTRKIDEEIIALGSMVMDSEESYLDHDFEGALTGVRAALEKLKEIEELSVRIKNQTLLWVYVVEWLSVTGVSLLSGLVVWTLMIRRKLYRKVGVTRLGRR